MTKRLLSLPDYIDDAISNTIEGSALDHRQLLGIGNQLEQVMNETEISPANPCEGGISVVMAHDLVAKLSLWYNRPDFALGLAHGH